MRSFVSAIKTYFSLDKILRLTVLFYALGLLSFGAYKHFKHPSLEKLVLGSDMEGYYQYMPYFFLRDWNDFQHLPWAKPYGEGKTLNVFTCGTAMLQSPFFLAAHGVTKLAGLKSDGYGPVYYFSVLLAGLFYATLGLMFLYKALLHWFERKTAFWTTALIFYATNLFYYTIMSPGTSHLYSFFLMAFLLFQIPRFYAQPDSVNTLLLAFPLALAVLIRPTNAVVVLFFVFCEVTTWSTLAERISFLIRKWNLLLLMILVSFLVFLPQLSYWHFVTGQWVIYSYQEEGFTFWKNPQVGTVLFGLRGGWYIYTPIMFVASVTLVFMAIKRLMTAPAILLVMIVILYINSSWWAPTFSASAGYRALIEFLPFMSVPLAFAYHKAKLLDTKWLKTLVTVCLWFFVVYNIQFAFKYDSTVWWDWEWSYKTMLRLFTF